MQKKSNESANGTASTQTVNIAGGTSTTSGGKTVNIATGTPGTSTTDVVNIGTGGSTTGTVAVTIGSNGAAAHVTDIYGGDGSGAISVQAASGGTISLGTSTNNILAIGTGTTTNTITIGGSSTSGNLILGQYSGSSSNTVTIGNGATTGTQTISIGTAATGTGVESITIGSINSSSRLTFQTGSGALNLNSTTSSTRTINIGSTSAGALTIVSGAASTIKTNAGNLTVQAGSGTVTLGSSITLTASGALTVQSGGANALNLDTGGSAAIDIGATNATSIVLGGNTSATITENIADSSTRAYTLQTAGGTPLLVGDSADNILYVGGAPASNTPTVLVLANFASGTNGYPTEVDGGMFYDPTTGSFQCGEDSAWINCGTGLASDTATVSGNVIGTTTTATEFNNETAAGTTYTPPLNDCSAGVEYQITATGVYNIATSGTNQHFDIALDMVNGGTVTTIATITSQTAGQKNDGVDRPWTFTGTITCNGQASDTGILYQFLLGEGLYTTNDMAYAWNTPVTVYQYTWPNDGASQLQLRGWWSASAGASTILSLDQFTVQRLAR